MTEARRIGPWPSSRVLDLAPVNWQKTLEESDAQQRLAANIFVALRSIGRSSTAAVIAAIRCAVTTRIVERGRKWPLAW